MVVAPCPFTAATGRPRNSGDSMLGHATAHDARSRASFAPAIADATPRAAADAAARAHPKAAPARAALAAACLTAVAALAAPDPAAAQYFGRNKVNYETFDFRIIR